MEHVKQWHGISPAQVSSGCMHRPACHASVAVMPWLCFCDLQQSTMDQVRQEIRAVAWEPVMDTVMEHIPSGYTIRPSAGLAAILLSIILLKLYAAVTLSMHELSENSLKAPEQTGQAGMTVRRASLAHLLVVLPSTLEENDRFDDADSTHEHWKHQGNRHPAEHLSIAIRRNNIQVEVCPRSVVALQGIIVSTQHLSACKPTRDMRTWDCISCRQ